MFLFIALIVIWGMLSMIIADNDLYHKIEEYNKRFKK